MPITGHRAANRPSFRSRLFFLFGVVLAAAPLQAADLDLQKLLARLALDGRRQEIAFEESRFSRLVTEPLLSRGRLIYEPPDTLIKRMEVPRRESAVLQDERLAILDAQDRELASIDLWLQPDLKMIYGSIKALLTGDADALRSAFWVSTEGGPEAWVLILRPKTDSARKRLELVRVEGRASRILSFEFLETDGDRSRLRLLAERPPE